MDTPAPTTKNIRLLRTVMELVTANPGLHDQDFWAHSVPGCGTTRCIAGWTNALSGYEEVWHPIHTEGGVDVYLVKVPDPITSEPGVRVTDPGDAAQEVLRLTADEADALFYADDIDAVWDIVEVITDGQILRADVEASVTASSRAVVTDVVDLVSA